MNVASSSHSTRAIQRALDRNLDIAVERIIPKCLTSRWAERQAFYRPTFGFNLDSSSRTNPSATQLDGGVVTETDTSNFDLSLNQPVRFGGGTLSVGIRQQPASEQQRLFELQS